ncbi:MAG: hypothetical protein IIY77_01590, partial [Lachnospiraceae bacterium]|nr:hypothetical protein [Lachnospiraceae bacterium]
SPLGKLSAAGRLMRPADKLMRPHPPLRGTFPRGEGMKKFDLRTQKSFPSWKLFCVWVPGVMLE